MNPVLKLVSGQSTNATSSEGSSAGEPIREFVPGFQARQPVSPASAVGSSTASLNASSSSLLQTGHLARCRRCGELNGRSAQTCWNCEAELHTGTLPTGVDLDPPSAANSDTPPSSLLPEFPVLTSSVTSSELRASDALAAGMPVSSLRRGPVGNLVAMAVMVIVLAGAGTFLYLDNQDAETAARSAAAARGRAATTVRPAEPAVSVNGVAAPAPSGELSSVDAALRTAELLTESKQEPMPADVPPAERVIAAPVVPKSAVAAAAAHKPRGATRSLAPSPAAVPAPQAYAPAARVRPPAPAAGPCTSNVAALGLCSAPASSQTKE